MMMSARKRMGFIGLVLVVSGIGGVLFFKGNVGSRSPRTLIMSWKYDGREVPLPAEFHGVIATAIVRGPIAIQPKGAPDPGAVPLMIVGTEYALTMQQIRLDRGEFTLLFENPSPQLWEFIDQHSATERKSIDRDIVPVGSISPIPKMETITIIDEERPPISLPLSFSEQILHSILQGPTVVLDHTTEGIPTAASHFQGIEGVAYCWGYGGGFYVEGHEHTLGYDDPFPSDLFSHVPADQLERRIRSLVPN